MMTLREAVDRQNKRKREERNIAKDVEEERTRWGAKWAKGDRGEEERLRKNWGGGVEGCEGGEEGEEGGEGGE
jgi:hypothetical protein